MNSFLKPSKRTTQSAESVYFYTTNTKEKVLFKPLKNNHVTIYSCGPTVYDFPHIGNYRPYVVADVLKRVLTHAGYTLKHVINITDVGHLTDDGDMGKDKMEAGAEKRGMTVPQIAKEVEEVFMKDLSLLSVATEGVLFPRATEHIKEQIAFIETLEQKGYTYQTSDGVYFDTTRFPAYGSLGNRDINEQREGARVEVNPEKRHPADFALWKKSPQNEKRQQEWESPWGVGFPGWHIECSAMAIAHLGKTIDIHMGGVDHVSTHHNNEIAQSESATGKTFVQNWIHTEHISVEGHKISKSVGNTIYLRNIIDRGISPLSYRYWLLQGHYRTRMNFTWEALKGAHTALFKIHKYFTEQLQTIEIAPVHAQYSNNIITALRDDIDTPKAIALVWELIKDDSVPLGEKKSTLLLADSLLGLNLHGRDALLTQAENKKIVVTSLPDNIQKMVSERDEARKNKDWNASDALRDELTKQGYVVTDSEHGTTLEKSSQTPPHE